MSVDAMVEIETKECPLCGEKGWVSVPAHEYMLYLDGVLIQDALVTTSLDIREQIISGTHPKCWDDMFGGDDEDDYPEGPEALEMDVLMEALGE